MTSEERERMNQLCWQLQGEKNPAKFDEMVKELNQLLDEKPQHFPPTGNLQLK